MRVRTLFVAHAMFYARTPLRAMLPRQREDMTGEYVRLISPRLSPPSRFFRAFRCRLLIHICCHSRHCLHADINEDACYSAMMISLIFLMPPRLRAILPLDYLYVI